jgi:hypothetical protein
MPNETLWPFGTVVVLLRPTGAVKMPSSDETALGAVGIEQPVKTTVIVKVLTSASFMALLQ